MTIILELIGGYFLRILPQYTYCAPAIRCYDKKNKKIESVYWYFFLPERFAERNWCQEIRLRRRYLFWQQKRSRQLAGAKSAALRVTEPWHSHLVHSAFDKSIPRELFGAAFR